MGDPMDTERPPFPPADVQTILGLSAEDAALIFTCASAKRVNIDLAALVDLAGRTQDARDATVILGRDGARELAARLRELLSQASRDSLITSQSTREALTTFADMLYSYQPNRLLTQTVVCDHARRALCDLTGTLWPSTVETVEDAEEIIRTIGSECEGGNLQILSLMLQKNIADTAAAAARPAGQAGGASVATPGGLPATGAAGNAQGARHFEARPFEGLVTPPAGPAPAPPGGRGRPRGTPARGRGAARTQGGPHSSLVPMVTPPGEMRPGNKRARRE